MLLDCAGSTDDPFWKNLIEFGQAQKNRVLIPITWALYDGWRGSGKPLRLLFNRELIEIAPFGAAPFKKGKAYHLDGLKQR